MKAGTVKGQSKARKGIAPKPATPLAKEIGLASEFFQYTQHFQTEEEYRDLVQRLEKWKAIAAHCANRLAPHVWN